MLSFGKFVLKWQIYGVFEVAASQVIAMRPPMERCKTEAGFKDLISCQQPGISNSVFLHLALSPFGSGLKCSSGSKLMSCCSVGLYMLFLTSSSRCVASVMGAFGVWEVSDATAIFVGWPAV